MELLMAIVGIHVGSPDFYWLYLGLLKISVSTVDYLCTA